MASTCRLLVRVRTRVLHRRITQGLRQGRQSPVGSDSHWADQVLPGSVDRKREREQWSHQSVWCRTSQLLVHSKLGKLRKMMVRRSSSAGGSLCSPPLFSSSSSPGSLITGSALRLITSKTRLPLHPNPIIHTLCQPPATQPPLAWPPPDPHPLRVTHQPIRRWRGVLLF